jgi:hypothetical protein
MPKLCVLQRRQALPANTVTEDRTVEIVTRNNLGKREETKGLLPSPIAFLGAVKYAVRICLVFFLFELFTVEGQKRKNIGKKWKDSE